MTTNKKEILNVVLPRIWQPKSTDTAQMALEILDGPYRGVVYGYTTFDVVGELKDDGTMPVKYETSIYSAPADFQKDESFDAFTSEVLVAWLEMVLEAELNPNATP